jgi:pyruvate-formate lyase-activating enzyme
MLAPELSRIAQTLQEMPFPKKFAVEVTAHCNLACSMCHHPNMKRPKGRIPFELWKRCADQLAAASPDTDCWFSFCGEPLLEPALLFRILAYGKSVGLCSLNVNTNGVLLTPELAGPLLDSGATLIVIGIDALSREVYEKVRVGGDRDVVYANVEFLLAERGARGSGPEVQVQFIEMDENAHEMEAFSNYWLARGATVKLRNKLSWGGRFATPLCVAPEERIPCPWAMTQMHVFWDGRVPRCPGDTEGDESAGNLWDEPLEVLWARLGTYRALHMSRRFDQLPAVCQNCKDWMVGESQRVKPHAARFGETTPDTNAASNVTGNSDNQPRSRRASSAQI